MRAYLALLAVASVGCLEPTQITFDLRTDVPCDEVETIGLSVGPSGTVEGKPPVMTTSECTPGEKLNAVGTYAVVPQDGPVEVAVRVVLASKGVALETDCTQANGYKGCVVARRTVSFVPRRGLVIPIDLFLVCKEVACEADSTCNRLGRCVSARVDTQKCEGNSCELLPDATQTPPARAALSSWVASPQSITADGNSTTTLTLTLRDAFNQPVVGQLVSLNASGSNNFWSTFGDSTDDAGVFVAKLASSTAERKTVTASTTDLTLETSVTFVDGGSP